MRFYIIEWLVSENMFSAIVFMALMTTIISPIMFKFLVLKGYGVQRKKLIRN